VPSAHGKQTEYPGPGENRPGVQVVQVMLLLLLAVALGIVPDGQALTNSTTWVVEPEKGDRAAANAALPPAHTAATDKKIDV